MSSKRGNHRENRCRDWYADQGWFAMCGRASRGPADVMAAKAGVIHLVQVKSSNVERGPYADFGPGERRELLAAAEQAGGTAHLCWWPKAKEPPVFIPWFDWPNPNRQLEGESAA